MSGLGTRDNFSRSTIKQILNMKTNVRQDSSLRVY